MLAVERHFHKGNAEIIRLCQLSKELYNRCTFLMRKSWFEHKFPLPDITILLREVKDLDCFKQLHNTKTAKQTVRKCLTDWSNFRKAWNAYKKDPSKFVRRPKPPNYKEKMAQVIFYNETIKGGQTGKPLTQLTATNNCFSIPCTKSYKQVVVTPKTFGFVIEVQYETDEQVQSKPAQKLDRPKVSKDKVCCIDIGLNTLAAITSDQHSPLLVNGRILKSINQWYNKRPCKTRSRKRYFRIENYFHHVSKMIVFNCLKYGIGTIIIGKNNGWKNGMNLGKKTNQAFCAVPTYLLLEKIKYKAAMEGIEVVFTEESYTSKASFLDRDPLPAYGEAEPQFSGQRVKRGLYRAGDGRLLNADVNGSANIGRKVIRNSDVIARLDRSLAARPVVINPLKTEKLV
jgi:putative transposase